MKMQELYHEYDKLQKQYGAAELHSIYNGGMQNQPDICFIFMNPTRKNIASLPDWDGPRSPWIGTKQIWKLFHQLHLLDHDLFMEIMKRKPNEWDKAFAELVYASIGKHRAFITNLGKCTQLDARPLPNSVYKAYLELLCQEIELIQPQKIIAFGNQVSSLLLGQQICVSHCRTRCFPKQIGSHSYPLYPVYYPVGNGLRNLDKAIADIAAIIQKK